MKTIWKYIKKVFKWVFFLVVFLVLSGIVFVSISPEFGGDPTEEDIKRYKQTGHYEGERFKNYNFTSMDYSFSQIVEVVGDYLDDSIQNIPKNPLPVIQQDSLFLEETKQEAKLIWFGHSAFLMQLDGKNILLDPMFGEVPAPVDFAAKPRFFKDLPVAIEKLPQIDYVFISHDHYDHLDYESIEVLKSKTKQFILPVGVGTHFRAWGIEESKIHEYNWWEEDTIDGLNFVFTPARHFSGRGAFNQNSTLWGSWVIKGIKQRIFFSGDGGYDDHFREIGDRFGPFDLAMVECGQYNKYWKDIHMAPEESAQALKDLKAKIGVPIHWGAFSLSTHDWFEPPVRIKKAADSLGIKVVTPQLGELINLDTINSVFSDWWTAFK